MKKNVLMTKCNKGGIKIKDTNNGYRTDPFENVNPFNVVQEKKLETKKYDSNSYRELDLNVNSYSRVELYRLFGLTDSTTLNEGIMKECKKIVLKTHPDKSNLDNKYFVFFSEAYKKLLGVYEFQNKTDAKKMDNSEYYEKNNVQLLDNMFETDKRMKEPKNFNKWFNDQFEKYRLEDPVESGYGNWLKSEEDIVFTPTNITKDRMASEMEKRKKQVQTMTTYNGVNNMSSHAFGGSSLIAYDDNFTSDSLFRENGMGFTDLKQAYVESVIPVTEEDYKKIPKFKSIDEYRKHRENTEITPIGKEEAMRRLYNENKEKDQESAALAFYYAKQAEKVKNNNNQFWTGLKQIHC